MNKYLRITIISVYFSIFVQTSLTFVQYKAKISNFITEIYHICYLNKKISDKPVSNEKWEIVQLSENKIEEQKLANLNQNSNFSILQRMTYLRIMSSKSIWRDNLKNRKLNLVIWKMTLMKSKSLQFEAEAVQNRLAIIMYTLLYRYLG